MPSGLGWLLGTGTKSFWFRDRPRVVVTLISQIQLKISLIKRGKGNYLLIYTFPIFSCTTS